MRAAGPPGRLTVFGYNGTRTQASAARPDRSTNMRTLIPALGLLALAVAAVAVTSGVAHGQDGETIHVYKSPT